MARNTLILDRYRPIEEAGAGGFGTVVQAWDTRIQRKVAIKIIELNEVDAARAALPGANAVRHPAGTHARERAEGAAAAGETPVQTTHELPRFEEVDWDEAPPWDEPAASNDAPPWEDPAAFALPPIPTLAPAPTPTPADNDPFDPYALAPVRSMAHIPGLDEARTAAMLTDPNIVTVYDFEVRDRTAYLIMEFVEGVTLTRLLRDYSDYLTLDMVAAVFTSVAHALEVAHENQVLHLDIKPDNVLINRQGQVKVTDFGLATLADAGGFGAAGGGTIGYMPLEQMRSESLDARCDEWALASVTYEMLAGQNPFIAPDLDRAETAIEDAELVLPSLCWDELDPAADDVMFYALDPDREQRYDNVTDFAEEMEKFLGDPKRGRRELAVLVGDAQGEGEGEEEEDIAPAPRPPRPPLRERLTPFHAKVAAHLIGALGSAAVAFVALANLPQVGGLDGILGAAGPQTILFWGLFALITLAGALKPHLGALLAYCALGIALVAQNAPAAGCVFLAATGTWWYFAGREGNATANATFAVPLAGAVGGNQLAPLAAGFFLTPARAFGTTVFSLVVAVILGSFGEGTLLGWGAFTHGFFAGVDVQANLATLLTQPATWCIAVSWLAAAPALAACRLRPSRVLAALGVLLAAALLAAGICAAAWFASSGHTWIPSTPALISTILAIIALIIATWLTPPTPREQAWDNYADYPDEETAYQD